MLLCPILYQKPIFYFSFIHNLTSVPYCGTVAVPMARYITGHSSLTSSSWFSGHGPGLSLHSVGDLIPALGFKYSVTLMSLYLV